MELLILSAFATGALLVAELIDLMSSERIDRASTVVSGSQALAHADREPRLDTLGTAAPANELDRAA